MSDTLRVIQLMVQKFRDHQLSLVGSLSPLFIRVLKKTSQVGWPWDFLMNHQQYVMGALHKLLIDYVVRQNDPRGQKHHLAFGDLFSTHGCGYRIG